MLKFLEESPLDYKNIELSEIWGHFNGEPHVFLATIDNDQPRVRPVTLIHLKEELFITTGSHDAKVRQIRQNPKTEFCLLLEKDESKGTLRAECVAEIVDDKMLKQMYSPMFLLQKNIGTAQKILPILS